MENRFDISQFVNVLTPQQVLCNLTTRVRARRKELKLSQQALARKSGVSYGSIRRFERTGEISLTSLLQIARVIDCLSDFEQLFSTPKILDLKEYIKMQEKSRRKGK